MFLLQPTQTSTLVKIRFVTARPAGHAMQVSAYVHMFHSPGSVFIGAAILCVFSNILQILRQSLINQKNHYEGPCEGCSESGSKKS